jgi:hypothetical protein
LNISKVICGKAKNSIGAKGSHGVEWKRNRLWGALFLAAAVLSILTGLERSAARQDTDSDERASVRVVHGIADAGPLDIYVDGAIALIGIQFRETSGDLHLSGGSHDFAVVPTGETLDSPIAAGAVSLQAKSLSYAALFGTSTAASVGLFSVDDRPVDEGRARFRVVSGVVDAESIVPAFVGGDAISEPLAFGDASQYAAIDAGTYDLDILDAVSGSSLLTVTQVPLAEGTINDVFLVGSVSDGSQQAVVVTIEGSIARIPGSRAQILSGTCDAPETELADLGLVRVGQGDAVGASDVASVAQGYAVVAFPFISLVETPHAIAIIADGASSEGPAACGNIGGRLTDTGALVMSLQLAGSNVPAGIAVLAPTIENPDATGVSVFLVTGPPGEPTIATPEPA